MGMSVANGLIDSATLNRIIALIGVDLGSLPRSTPATSTPATSTPATSTPATSTPATTTTQPTTAQPTPVFTREEDAASNQCRGTPDQCAAARELWNHIMTTRGAQRDRSLITRMQREMGGDIPDDGLWGRKTADRIFALTGLVIRGSTTGFPDQTRPGGTGTSTTGGTGTGGTGTGGADIARMAASSFTTADHIAAFFERNKIAIIASGSVLLAGGIAAIYLSTRDESF